MTYKQRAKNMIDGSESFFLIVLTPPEEVAEGAEPLTYLFSAPNEDEERLIREGIGEFAV